MDVKAPRGVSVVIDDREPYFVRPGDRIVMHAVDVDGTTVLVFVEAPAGGFDRFLQRATKVLRSVSFPSAD
jgi:hypothetical protein